MIHSSISIANAYVSEWVVAEAPLFSMSSGARGLSESPGDTTHDSAFSVTSFTILAIPKSQICGMPLPDRGRLVVHEPDVNAELTSSETNAFFCVPSVNSLSHEV